MEIHVLFLNIKIHYNKDVIPPPHFYTYTLNVIPKWCLLICFGEGEKWSDNIIMKFI